MAAREHFGSRFAAVMAMAGSAIGLGNIWRFPYMVGQNGGAAFIIVYLLAAVLLSLPIFMAESIIGRSTHQGTFGAMQTLAPGTKWKWLGLLTVASPLIIMSYYSVVGGWSIEYLLKSLTFGFNKPEVATEFGSFISSTWGPLLAHTAFMATCALIVVFGVKKGIENFSKITTPVLFVLIVIIMVFSCTLPGAYKGIEYLVKPDFSALTGEAVAMAVGQSFFSLSLGVGTILTYASYIKKEENLLSAGIGTSAFDLLFAIIAGFAIMPAVFASGIEPGAGPGLIFETLPFIFSKMAGTMPVVSGIIAILFFVTILFAALTSAISMYETGVAYLTEERHMSRKAAVLLIFAGCWTVGVLCSLSFGPLFGFKLIGNSIFDLLDKFASNILMPFGGILFTVFVGWIMPKPQVKAEITSGKTTMASQVVYSVMYFLIRFVAPVGILAIMISQFVL